MEAEVTIPTEGLHFLKIDQEGYLMTTDALTSRRFSFLLL